MVNVVVLEKSVLEKSVLEKSVLEKSVLEKSVLEKSISEQSGELHVEQEPRLDRYGFDPSLVAAARKIYRTYMEVHPEVTEEPLGIAIDRYTYRGKLIFVRMPALLPQETFIPFELFDR